MDQDVSLMKQLLTLNETINEIKHGRLSCSSKGSVSSRGFVSGSDWSFQSEMSISPDDEKTIFSGNPRKKLENTKDSSADGKDSKVSVADLWKVRSQISNDSGYVEDSTS